MSVLSSHKLLYSLPATLPSTCAGERRRRKIAFPDPGKESMACSFSKWIRVPHCRSCRARSRLKEGLASPVVWDGCCQRGGVCTLWSRARPVSALRLIPNAPKDPNPCRDLFHIMGKLGRQAPDNMSSCNITIEEAVLDSNQFNLHIQRQFITRFLQERKLLQSRRNRWRRPSRSLSSSGGDGFRMLSVNPFGESECFR